MREAALLSLEKALKGKPDHPDYLRLQATLHEEGHDLELALASWHEVRMKATAPRHRLIRDEAMSTLFLPPTALKLMRQATPVAGLKVRSVSSGGEALLAS